MLPKICDKEFALPLLAQSLLDEEGSVRKSAAAAIAAYRADATLIVDELVAALDDPNFNVQITIVRALGSIGPPAAAALPTMREIPAHGFAKDILDTAIAKISGEAPPSKKQTAP
jgi:HEAT repeat protein